MKNNNVFEKIINKTIPSDIVYQDKIVTAFRDIKPIAPIHILIVPNIFIACANEINKKNSYILGHMFYISTIIAKEENIHHNGYRTVINCNKHGGQEIDYLHMHLLGGKKLGRMC